MKYLPFILLLAVAVVIGVATVIEGRMGSDEARHLVYGTWWFVALWGAVCVAGCWHLLRKKMWRRPSALMLHFSMVVILVGALVTHLTSQHGFIHLREGEATCSYLQRSENEGFMQVKPMPFYLALDSFRVEYDDDGVTCSDYVSYVLISDSKQKERTTISMNNIGRSHGYRIFQNSYDEDGRGSVFSVSYDPWGTGVTYAGYLLLALSMIWNGRKGRNKSTSQQVSKSAQPEGMLAERSGARTSQQVGGSGRLIAFWILGVLLASYMVISIAFRPLVPVLRSPLLVVHVGVIMISYILLVVSMLKRSMLRIAVFFLMAGIFLGAMWANVSWGSYWSWDPKESWALITLVVYSLPLHSESLPWLRSTRNYRIYCALCLLCLLMTYFGVNYLLGGMHSYA